MQNPPDERIGGRPRVLVLVTYGFSARYLLPTGLLDTLESRFEPIVGIGWDEEELPARVRAAGASTTRLPDALLDHDYRMFRRRLAAIHQRRLDSPTTKLQRNRRAHGEALTKAAAIRHGREWADRTLTRLPGLTRRTESAEAAMIRNHTNVDAFRDMIEQLQVDAVISMTPYHDQDALTLWAAREQGIPTLTTVISFDNPTTRGRMVVRSERILVWNRYNEQELLRSYPDLTPERIGVIGAPQFDLHRNPDLLLEEGEWRARLGLPPGRPVLLYGAGPSELIEHEDRLVRLLDRAIADDRLTSSPILLVRRHPNDPAEPWRVLAEQLTSSVVVEPWAERSSAFRSWPSDEDIVLQMSTLAHTAVHLNVCSSMTLDGAMFDKPQICPAFIPGPDTGASKRVANLYRQEHWWPIERSGGIAKARNEAELISAVNHALRYPQQQQSNRRRMVEEVLTFEDGCSSRRLVTELTDLMDNRPGRAGTSTRDPPGE